MHPTASWCVFSRLPSTLRENSFSSLCWKGICIVRFSVLLSGSQDISSYPPLLIYRKRYFITDRSIFNIKIFYSKWGLHLEPGSSFLQAPCFGVCEETTWPWGQDWGYFCAFSLHGACLYPCWSLFLLPSVSAGHCRQACPEYKALLSPVESWCSREKLRKVCSSFVMKCGFSLNDKAS